jgi:DNA-binding beta-propeller fold protein YncE
MQESHRRPIETENSHSAFTDFKDDLEWFNAFPLSLKKELKGKIVILDFWSYRCIKCIHSLPDLAFLQQKYANEPVVFIGVHSPKFTNERSPENVRNAILRNDISYPVVNDPTLSMWKALEISSWPTFVIIDPKGNMLYSITGEGARDTLEKYINSILNQYPQEDFNTQPLPTYLPLKTNTTESPLNFPSKLAVDDEGHRLFISDSNNNRILIVSEEGLLIDVIGSGKRGFEEGAYQQTHFNHPQGIAYSKNLLYIADTENHAIRKVDLKTKTVTTLAGNGKQGHDYRGGLKGTDQELSSPWDIAIDHPQERLLVAMAGTHQIWAYDFKTEQAYALSGSGAEQNLNSTHPLEAAWAHPSSLAIHDNTLFVADSESSAIRSLNLKDGQTQTLVGGDPARPYNLFNFGDVDGSEIQAKLQYPLALLWLPKEQFIVVADTYNHKLKILDPIRKTLHSWIGNGHPGYRDGVREEAQFSEPSGLALSSDEKFIYVADTNNHVIRKVTIANGEVQTFALKNIPKPQPPALQNLQRLTEINTHSIVQLPPVRMIPNTTGSFSLEIIVPTGYFLEKEAPSAWQVIPQANMPIIVEPANAFGILNEDQIINIPFIFDPQSEKNSVQIEVLAHYYSPSTSNSRYVDGVLFDIPMEVGNESPNISLKYILKAQF